MIHASLMPLKHRWYVAALFYVDVCEFHYLHSIPRQYSISFQSWLQMVADLWVWGFVVACSEETFGASSNTSIGVRMKGGSDLQVFGSCDQGMKRYTFESALLCKGTREPICRRSFHAFSVKVDCGCLRRNAFATSPCAFGCVVLLGKKCGSACVSKMPSQYYVNYPIYS